MACLRDNQLNNSGLKPLSMAAVCLLCGTLSAAVPGSSPPGAPIARPVTLGEAKVLALERNWDLLAAAAGVDAAVAQRIVSHEFPNPTLSLSSFKINADNHPSSTTAGNGLWDRSY